MRILHLTDSLRSGGKERQLAELVKGLSGADCSVVSFSPENHYLDPEKDAACLYTLQRRWKKDPGVLLDLYRICRKEKPDLVHTWDSMSTIYAIPLCLALRLPLVNGMLRDAPANMTLKDTRRFRAVVSYPFSDVVVANSRAGLKAYSAPAGKSLAIHNGFDTGRLVLTHARQSVRERLGIKTEQVVGMVASNSGNKDYASFIAAANILLEAGREATFVGVGDRVVAEELAPLVHERFRDRFLFLGKRKDVESIVSIFTVGVLVSSPVHGEGISNVIMEYMASGKPVVASDSGGNREIVSDGQTGFLVPVGSVEMIAGRIGTLLVDPCMCETFGAAGRQRIVADFGYQRMIDQFYSLYEKVLHK